MQIDDKEPLPKSLVDLYPTLLKTKREAFYFNLTRKKTQATESKIFGEPYFPKNMSYPVCSKGNPMRLLVQINLSELPEKFYSLPTQGLLQIFVTTDYVELMEIEGDYKIILQSDLTLGKKELLTDYAFVRKSEMKLKQKWYWDGDEEYAVSFFKKNEYISTHDFHFEGVYTEEEQKLITNQRDYISNNFGCRYIKMGGYSDNEQGIDDRTPGAHDVLLFQIVSNQEINPQNPIDEELEIGGQGGFDIQFFINEEKLKNLDFEGMHTPTYFS